MSGKRRKSKNERCEQLLGIMHALHDKAKSKDEFTAGLIAEKAEVSEVLVYRLIGEEFKAMRSKLKGLNRSPKTVEAKLRRENTELRRQLKELKARHKVDINGDYTAAIRVIEAQDGEIRTLHCRVAILEARLAEGKRVLEVPTLIQEGADQDKIERQVNTSDNSDVVIEADGDYSN